MESSDIDDGVRELRQKTATMGMELVRALDELGTLTFETSTRFTLDPSSSVFAVKRPMHPTVIPGSSYPAEADGLIAGSHHGPRIALRDTEQALPVEEFVGLRESLRPFARALGREVV